MNPAPITDPVAAVLARWQNTRLEILPLEVTYTLAAVPQQVATLVAPVPPGKRLQALRDGLPPARIDVVPVAALQQALADLQALAAVAAARGDAMRALRAALAEAWVAASPEAPTWAAALALLDEITGGALVPPAAEVAA